MGILHAFDDSRPAVIEPSHILETIEEFPEIVLSAFEQKTIDAAVERYHAGVIGKLQCGFSITIYRLVYDGLPVALYQSVVGGPASAALMEEVIAKGGKRFLFFGVCGTLDKSLVEKGIVIPTAAYRDEGTSYHYLPPEKFIEIPTAGKLMAILDELHIPYSSGKTWTTDAIYRETRQKMLSRRQDGCVVVEMECASLMAVGSFRNIETYQFLYNGDNLDADQWDARTLGRLPHSDREKYLQLALEVAKRL